MINIWVSVAVSIANLEIDTESESMKNCSSEKMESKHIPCVAMAKSYRHSYRIIKNFHH